MLFPVPSSTSKIRWASIVEFRKHALSFLKVISFIARCAVSIGSVCLAEIGNWDTNFLGIENPSVGAGEADLLVPVPGSTSGIGGLGVVEVREDALSFLEVVSLEA